MYCLMSRWNGSPKRKHESVSAIASGRNVDMVMSTCPGPSAFERPVAFDNSCIHSLSPNQLCHSISFPTTSKENVPYPHSSRAGPQISRVVDSLRPIGTTIDTTIDRESASCKLRICNAADISCIKGYESLWMIQLCSLSDVNFILTNSFPNANALC